MSQSANTRSASHAFSLDADQQAVLDQADKFCRSELYPLAERMDKDEWWPTEVFEKIGAQGYLGITVPEKFGGAGMDFFTSGLVCQAMARWNYALSLSLRNARTCAGSTLFSTNAWPMPRTRMKVSLPRFTFLSCAIKSINGW